jgi:hypothetical protein
MTAYDDPRTSDQQLLEGIWELRLRDTLSRTPSASKASMEAGGCSPAGWAPLTASEHLELLQKQRWLELRLSRRDVGVRRALEAGASWADVADALGLDVEVVRAKFRVWVAGQRRLHAEIGIGLDDVEGAAAEALLGETTALVRP